MKPNFKNRLGIFKRGIFGIAQNNFEKVSSIPQEVKNIPSENRPVMQK